MRSTSRNRGQRLPAGSEKTNGVVSGVSVSISVKTIVAPRPNKKTGFDRSRSGHSQRSRLATSPRFLQTRVPTKRLLGHSTFHPSKEKPHGKTKIKKWRQ